MNQKMKDLQMLLKNDRRAWGVIGLFFLAVVFVVMGGDSAPRHTSDYTSNDNRVASFREAAANAEKSDIGGDSEKAYKDLTIAFGEDIKEIKRSTHDAQILIKRLEHDLSEHKTRATGIFDTLVDRLETLGGEIDTLKEENAKRGYAGSAGAYGVDGSMGADGGNYADGAEPDQLESFGMNEATVPPPPPPADPLRMKVITTGDSVPLKLLTGVNAPVDGTPYPVVFQLMGPVTGPDGSSLEVGEARLLAAAQGSESDGRVLFRLTKLAIRHTDGRRSEVDIDGWIVGEDGVRGMKGKLIDKLGRLIAATAGVSFTAAMGERIDDQADGIQINNSDNITVGGDDLSVAGASAFTDASNRIGELLLDRYESLIPVVEILPGREVVAVFSRSTEIEVFDQEEEYYGEGIYAAALD